MDNQNFALNSFIQRISEIGEADYGDFMRQANLHICNLRDALSGAGDAVKGKISEMQTYTQFASNWIVAPTKSRLLKDAETIRTWLIGEQQIVRIKPLHVSLPEYHKLWHWLRNERKT